MKKGQKRGVNPDEDHMNEEVFRSKKIIGRAGRVGWL